jgi:RNA polymerase sigma-70 factor, ECF subfamily
MHTTSPARIVSRAVDGSATMSDPHDPQPGPALDTWFTTVYDQLRGLARQRLANERADHTLQPTALVNEVFLRLQHDGSLSTASHAQFFLAAAEAMRRILIEHARAKGRKKRGGDGSPAGTRAQRISLDAAEWVTEDNVDQILTLDDAICRMEQTSPEQAKVVRLRFYAGLSVEETAKVMEVSEATVMRLWRYARAWLWRELQGDVEASP